MNAANEMMEHTFKRDLFFSFGFARMVFFNSFVAIMFSFCSHLLLMMFPRFSMGSL